jgi:hypothetical protein
MTKDAHHLVKGFAMIPKKGMGGLHNLGRVRCDHIQTNKQTPILMYRCACALYHYFENKHNLIIILI